MATSYLHTTHLKSFKWMNNLFLTKKIQIFSESLMTQIIIFSWKKTFKNNYILNKILKKNEF